MAFLWLAGAETSDTGELSSIVNVSVSGSPAPHSAGLYVFSVTGGINNLGISPLFTANANITARIYFRCASVGSGEILRIRNESATLAEFTIDGASKLTAQAIGGTTQTGSTTLVINTWYRIDIKYSAGSGSNAIAEIRLNGTVEATSTNGTATLSADNIAFLGGDSGGSKFYDDILVISGTTYPSDGTTVALRPDGAGTDNSVDYDGTFADVNDDPIDDTTARNKTVSGESAITQTLTTNTIGSGINAIRIGARLKRSTGGGSNHRIRSRGEGTFEDSADINLSTSFAYYTFDPTAITLPTTQGDVDAYEAGVNHDGAQDYSISEIWVMLDFVPATATPLTVTVSDDANNLADSLTSVVLGFVLGFADDANNLSDLLSILGYGHLFTDSLDNWGEAIALDRSLILTDDINNWTEAIEVNLGLQAIFTDDLNNWLDVHQEIFGFAIQPDDTITFSDSLTTLDYGHQFTDNLDNWAERQDLGYGLVFDDNLNNWADLIEIAIVLQIAASDNLDNWLDDTQRIFGHLIQPEDTIAFSDELTTLGYGNQLTDDLNSWNEAQALGHGLIFTDDLNFWADNVETNFLGFFNISVSDDASNWTDALGAGYGNLFTDDLNAWSDELTKILGQLIAVADNANNLSDSTEINLAHLINVVDSINNWLETVELLFTYRLDINDNMNNWLDAINSLFTYLVNISDNLNNWLDAVSIVLTDASTNFLRSVADDLNNWLDAINISFSFISPSSNYYRRYLNDPLVSDSGSPISVPPITIFDSAFVSYVRRYLDNPLVLDSGSPLNMPTPEMFDNEYIRRYLDDPSSARLINVRDSLDNWQDAVLAVKT